MEKEREDGNEWRGFYDEGREVTWYHVVRRVSGEWFVT
jgi:hypothetical protein